MQNLSEKRSDERIFVPLVRPNTPKNIISKMCEYSGWIALNHYEIQRQKSIYNLIKNKGLHEFYNIPNKTKILLTSTAPDKYLLFNLFLDGPKKFRKDVIDLRPDYFMGPDLLTYKYLPNKINELFVNKTIELASACTDIQGLLPNIHGENESQRDKYITTFTSLGYKTFILPGREHIINLKERKKDEKILTSVVSRLKNKYDINILVTGPSTPRQHKIINSAKGFIGLGYFTLAMKRILFMEYKTSNIMTNKYFNCLDECCGGLVSNQLCLKENDTRRIVHNLLAIQKMINLPIEGVQAYLH